MKTLLTGWGDDVVAADAVRVHGGLLDDRDVRLAAEAHDAVLGHHHHQAALGVLEVKGLAVKQSTCRHARGFSMVVAFLIAFLTFGGLTGEQPTATARARAP